MGISELCIKEIMVSKHAQVMVTLIYTIPDPHVDPLPT
jgi:hypothetical protein